MRLKRTAIQINFIGFKHQILRTALCVQVVLSIFAIAPCAEAFHPISSRVDIISAYPVYPQIDYAGVDRIEAVKRGEYLVKMGDCIACHTHDQPQAQAFAGGLPIPTPFGTFYSPNITPDEATGIGSWTEAEFIRAMRFGILADGSNAFPAFPYVYFNRVTEQDLRDIWAYLRAIPAVHRTNQGNTLPFPLNIRFLQYGWKLLYFYPDQGVYNSNPTRSKQWNRGAYLVQGLGHCAMCHSPMNLFGAEQKRYFLTGSFIQGFWAPDITGTGLAAASKYQIADVFRTGQLVNQAGPVRGPMADANHDSLQYLTENDRLAIAEYLKSINGREPRNVSKLVAQQEPLKRGEQVYANVCVVCHLNGEIGAPRIGNQADWQQRVLRSGISGLYGHAINGYNKMPIKGACVTCDDRDIIHAVDYLLYRSLESSQWYALNNKPAMPRQQATGPAVGKTVYQETCSICHEQGKLGAPKTGDKQQWAARIEKNFDVLIVNTLNGINNMPPKGGCTYCTGSEIIAAVKFMVQQSQVGNDYSLW